MLKRWVFNACWKAGCESMSLMSVGETVPDVRPLTENACRPNCVLVQRTTVDLVVDDCSWHWCALRLNATRSLRYGGERWWKILYINVVTLKVIRNFIGSQRSWLNQELCETGDWGQEWAEQLHSEPVEEGWVLMQEGRLVQHHKCVINM